MLKVNYIATIKAAALNDEVVNLISWMFDVPAEMVIDDIDAERDRLEKRATKQRAKTKRRRRRKARVQK